MMDEFSAITRSSVHSDTSSQSCSHAGTFYDLLSQMLVAPHVQRHFRGNSDPFICLPIEITPQVNQTLAFMRDGYFPNIFDKNKLVMRIGRQAFSPVSLGSEIWQWSLKSIYDSGTAQACIATYLKIMAGLASESGSLNATRLSLALATRSLNALRKSLQDVALPSDAGAPINLISHVYYLHRVSLHTRDHAATLIHSELLNKLVVKAVARGDIDHMILWYTALDSVDASTRFMSRTSFDHSWFGRTCAPLWDMVERDLPEVPSEVFEGLSPNIQGEELRRAFLTSRHMNAYAENPPPPAAWKSSGMTRRSVFGWFVSKGVWAIGMAMDIFLDVKDRPYLAGDVSLGQHLTQGAWL
ncbi:hypothetical protein H2200_001198 [Cladophialophora chaetospira]|uniref:Uncharacterized protein n=1 Tax=Cladophialophora chaetospira TaxID=386627 RepID=A0AA38XKF8_9EURO|nr:hypothetical protein H2200_001198 [Cladophialophora chaetospira]